MLRGNNRTKLGEPSDESSMGLSWWLTIVA